MFVAVVVLKWKQKWLIILIGGWNLLYVGYRIELWVVMNVLIAKVWNSGVLNWIGLTQATKEK